MLESAPFLNPAAAAGEEASCDRPTCSLEVVWVEEWVETIVSAIMHA